MLSNQSAAANALLECFGTSGDIKVVVVEFDDKEDVPKQNEPHKVCSFG